MIIRSSFALYDGALGGEFRGGVVLDFEVEVEAYVAHLLLDGWIGKGIFLGSTIVGTRRGRGGLFDVGHADNDAVAERDDRDDKLRVLKLVHELYLHALLVLHDGCAPGEIQHHLTIKGLHWWVKHRS